MILEMFQQKQTENKWTILSQIKFFNTINDTKMKGFKKIFMNNSGKKHCFYDEKSQNIIFLNILTWPDVKTLRR
jgi:hypothetical protein